MALYSIPDLALCLHRRYFSRTLGFCRLGFRGWRMGYHTGVFGGYLLGLRLRDDGVSRSLVSRNIIIYAPLVPGSLIR
jgi:hypothetical protein